MGIWWCSNTFGRLEYIVLPQSLYSITASAIPNMLASHLTIPVFYTYRDNRWRRVSLLVVVNLNAPSKESVFLSN